MMIDRKIIPINNERQEIHFPSFSKNILLNGVPVYSIQDNSQPLISIKLLFKHGAYHEHKSGLSNFVSQMMLLGNNIYNAEQIAEKIDYYGASFFSNSNWDETIIGFICLADYLEPMLDLLVNCVYESKFDENEIERLKKKLISNIQHQNSDANYITQIAFNERVFQNLSYQRPRVGKINSIQEINQNDCKTLYNELLKSNLSIIISGNFQNSIFDTLSKKIKNSNNTDEKFSNFEENSDNKNEFIKIIKEDAKQITFRIGKRSIDRGSELFPQLMALNTMFGGYFLSRLNSNLREKKGYTYGINSFIDTRKIASSHVIGSNINEDNGLNALQDIFAEIELFNNIPILNDELDRAKNFMYGSFIRGMETPIQISQLIQTILAYNLDMDYFDKFHKKLVELDCESIIETQKKFFSMDQFIIVASGKSEKLKDMDNYLANLNYNKFEYNYDMYY